MISQCINLVSSYFILIIFCCLHSGLLSPSTHQTPSHVRAFAYMVFLTGMLSLLSSLHDLLLSIIHLKVPS